MTQKKVAIIESNWFDQKDATDAFESRVSKRTYVLHVGESKLSKKLNPKFINRVLELSANDSLVSTFEKI